MSDDLKIRYAYELVEELENKDIHQIVINQGNGKKLIYDRREKTRWIPCSERLPEEWRDVLLSFDKSITEWTNVGYMFRDKETFEYWFQSDGMSYKKDDVLAWMPLPNAYEEDD